MFHFSFFPHSGRNCGQSIEKVEEELYKHEQVGSDQPVANRTYRWFLCIYAASHPQVLH